MKITNEIGVRELFARMCRDYGFEIESSGTAFPDYTLKDGNDTVQAEAEYKSGNFIAHRHDSAACDLVICWEHNMALPVRVLELKTGCFYDPGKIGETKRARHKKGNSASDVELDDRLLALLREVDKECFDYWLESCSIVVQQTQFNKCSGGAALALAQRLRQSDPDVVHHLAFLWLQVHNSGKLNTSGLNDEQEIKSGGN